MYLFNLSVCELSLFMHIYVCVCLSVSGVCARECTCEDNQCLVLKHSVE